MSKKAHEKARVLLECLPYIREFRGKTFVIKYGGHAMTSEALKHAFAQDIVLLKYIGINPVIVHGGGPQIERMMNQLGKKGTFVDGMRVTDAETMEIVEMVLGGKINTDIVSLINGHGGRAVGLCGKDAWFIRAERMEIVKGGKPVDIGLVGEVTEIEPSIVTSLTDGGFIPVIAPYGVGPDGESLNINADLVAGKVAEALKAEKLIVLTDTPGVLDRKDQLISSITYTEAVGMVRKKDVISGGMIPKIQCCIDALKSGVNSCHIIDGRVEHSVVLETFTQQGMGTKIDMGEDGDVAD